MRFQIQRDNGLWYSAEYAPFAVGPETDKYRLSVSGFSGDAGDAISAPVKPKRIANGMQFSTPDQDNNMYPNTHCHETKGWWYGWCSASVLTYFGKANWNADTDEFIRDVIFDRMLVKLY